MSVFSSAELKMSLASSPELAIISKEEMEIKIKDFAAGFGDKIEYVKSHTGPIQKKIEGASFIAGILSSDKEEEVGYKISISLEELIKLIGVEFEMIVRYNFNLEAFKRTVIMKRAEIEEDEEINQIIVDGFIDKPEKLIYDIEKENKNQKITNDLTEVYKDWFENCTTAQQIKVKQHELAKSIKEQHETTVMEINN